MEIVMYNFCIINHFYHLLSNSDFTTSKLTAQPYQIQKTSILTTQQAPKIQNIYPDHSPSADI
jgi:hypothetical protein